MESPDTSSPLTFEQVMAILDQRSRDTLAKLEIEKALHREEMRKRDEEMRKRSSEFQEEMRKRDEEIRRRDAERAEEMRKRDAERAEEIRRRDAEMQRHNERMEYLSRRFGEFGNRLGELTELMVSPYLKEKFNAIGFDFRSVTTRTEISDGSGKIITDVDVFLLNGAEIMAIEVKTRPTLEDVERHVLRMEQILSCPPFPIHGMKLYGAIGCAILSEDVKLSAFSSGFFVISQVGDYGEILVPGDDFVPRYWSVPVK